MAGPAILLAMRFHVSLRACRLLAVLLTLNAVWGSSLASVRLPKVFGDHMVLQREQQIRVWGWADPGEDVTVRFGGAAKSTSADAGGRWSVFLNPMKANAKPQELTVSGKSVVTIHDVLVGDVWLCSGQSNMAFGLGGCDAPEDIKSADMPSVRYLSYWENFRGLQQEDAAMGSWSRMTPTSAPGCSAVAFYFGRRVFRETGIPIGLLEATVGGTEIECWMPPEAFRDYPNCAPIGKALQDAVSTYKTNLPRALQALEKWIPEAKSALAAGREVPIPPHIPLHPNEDRFGTWVRIQSLYNGMIHPLTPFTIKGALWYQGESNGNEEQLYVDKLTALIGTWRRLWGCEFPFYFAQIANFQQPTNDPNEPPAWAFNRMAMLRCFRALPKTGMAVTIDVGDANDIHPRNKFDVGERLALWALAKDYGKSHLTCSGPIFRSMKVEGSKLRLSFDFAEGGLMVGEKVGLGPAKPARGAKLARFAVAGEDRKFHWAEAVIDGATVVVSCAAVSKPVAVRYAFSINPAGANLYNREGLPASPFRTDDW